MQGGTIGPLLRVVSPEVDREAVDEHTKAEVTRLFELLRSSAETIPEPPHPEGDPTPAGFSQARDYRLAVIAAQRSALLDARDKGSFEADVLANALANLDASEIAIELRGTLTT